MVMKYMLARAILGLTITWDVFELKWVEGKIGDDTFNYNMGCI